MLARVRTLPAEGRRVVVVVSALDRFGRRLLESVRSREELDSLGVVIHSVRAGELNETMANSMAVIAHEESKRISVRVRRAWAHLADRGWYKVSSRLSVDSIPTRQFGLPDQDLGARDGI